MKTIKVNKLPDSPEPESAYEILPDRSAIVGSTHRLFNKYPTRFIPQVPRWGIMKYSAPGDYVLDPFCGSGTTLVEAMLNGRNGVAGDIDPFARLLTRVKTTRLSSVEVEDIEKAVSLIKNRLKQGISNWTAPNIPNITKWFTDENVEKLASIRSLIEDVNNDNVKNYLMIVFAGIIRRCSNAELVSPKPYISTRFPRTPDDPYMSFFETDELYRGSLESFSNETSEMNVENIFMTSNDARDVKSGKVVSLAFTSPPYINAYDYVRILKFENMWLGLADNEELVSSRKRFIGAETISSFHENYEHAMKSETLTEIIPQIEEVDKRRADMVLSFFEDMALNIISVNSELEKKGRYVIVVGDSTIRKQLIPTGRILTEIAVHYGFEKELSFKYLIRDRYLHLPRGGRGGIIKYDEILTLRKSN